LAQPTIWTLVLAAGAGRRLAEVTGGVPKQFWQDGGGPSLLRQTIDRFTPLAPRARTVVVVDAGHRAHYSAADIGDWVPDLLLQPLDRGTAAGVLLALMPVLIQEPGAVVVITPSDHGVLNEAVFRSGVLKAAREAAARDAVVLCGVEPEEAHTDYGWISLGDPFGANGLRGVVSFTEKPRREDATRLLASGAVWNTMIIVARARTLWGLYRDQLPGLARSFARAFDLGDAARKAYFENNYSALPMHDFSRDLLTRAEGLSALVWPATIGWSDLGTPQRLSDWHRGAPARRSGGQVISAA